jgi:hypothetical protein
VHALPKSPWNLSTRYLQWRRSRTGRRSERVRDPRGDGRASRHADRAPGPVPRTWRGKRRRHRRRGGGCAHTDVGDEDAPHLVVGDVSEQLVDAATLPGPARGEEVAVRAECRVRIVFHQQALPLPGDGLRGWNLPFGRPERCDHLQVRTSEQLVEDGVVTLQDDGGSPYEHRSCCLRPGGRAAHPAIPVPGGPARCAHAAVQSCPGHRLSPRRVSREAPLRAMADASFRSRGQGWSWLGLRGTAL